MTPTPTELFVPLLQAPATASPRADFHLALAEHPDRALPFRQNQPSAPLNAANQNSASSACVPQVSLQREGDRIIGIRVLCSCGQTIDLACQY